MWRGDGGGIKERRRGGKGSENTHNKSKGNLDRRGNMG
jgi:hypothetical protein